MKFAKKLTEAIWNRRRSIALAFIDLCLLSGCYMASWLVVEGKELNWKVMLFLTENVIAIMLAMILFRVYANIWRYAQIKDFLSVVGSIVTASTACYILNRIFGWHHDIVTHHFAYTSFSFIACLFVLTLSRMIYRTMYDNFKNPTVSSRKLDLRKRTVIVGAGQACRMLLAEIQHVECGYAAVGIVDDDAGKISRYIEHIPIFGPISDIAKIREQLQAEVIIIAIPSVSDERRREIIKFCSDTKCEVKIIPQIHNIIDSKRLVSQARTINVEDLLGREPVTLDITESESLIGGKVCMVTGGGGSIGSELCRQIMTYNPALLLIVDIYENNAYDIQQELLTKYGPGAPLKVHISSVRDMTKMDKLFDTYRPNVVFHAAAHKHVPLMENDPEEAVKNNVGGTYNLAFLADKYKTDKVVLISSDKAVNPTNVMGATKRFCEMIIQSFNESSEHTDYAAVRFGNVLGSNGSVIPLFNKLIDERQDLPITHPEITRFFMTIPEAVSLVLRAGAMASGGEIFVLDMGKPVKIVDLAVNLIKLHGLEPHKDIKIKYVGLRPGEKLYEETLMGGKLQNTKHGKIFIEQTAKIDSKKLFKYFDDMETKAEENKSEQVIDVLLDAIPTYSRTSDGIFRPKAAKEESEFKEPSERLISKESEPVAANG